MSRRRTPGGHDVRAACGGVGCGRVAVASGWSGCGGVGGGRVAVAGLRWRRGWPCCGGRVAVASGWPGCGGRVAVASGAAMLRTRVGGGHVADPRRGWRCCGPASGVAMLRTRVGVFWSGWAGRGGPRGRRSGLAVRRDASRRALPDAIPDLLSSPSRRVAWGSASGRGHPGLRFEWQGRPYLRRDRPRVFESRAPTTAGLADPGIGDTAAARLVPPSPTARRTRLRPSRRPARIVLAPPPWLTTHPPLPWKAGDSRLASLARPLARWVSSVAKCGQPLRTDACRLPHALVDARPPALRLDARSPPAAVAVLPAMPVAESASPLTGDPPPTQKAAQRPMPPSTIVRSPRRSRVASRPLWPAASRAASLPRP
jgi:hypothetical protein